jgi:hypothetical protein
MNDFQNCRRSRNLKALKGRTVLARGKRDSGSAPPRVAMPQNKPLTAIPRDSANLICGILSSLVPARHSS